MCVDSRITRKVGISLRLGFLLSFLVLELSRLKLRISLGDLN